MQRLALATCAAFIVFVRLRTWGEPPDVDGSVYAVIAREMLHGARLYLDVWDIKPPPVYLLYAAAEWFVGFGPAAIFLLSASAALVTLLAVYRAGHAVGGPPAGLVAGALWALVSHDVVLQANMPNAAVFANAALAWGFAWALEGRTLRPGLAFALATMFKPAAIFVPAMLGLAVLVWPERDRRAEARRVGVWLAVGAAAWGLALAWAALTGRFWRFVQTIFGYGAWYVSNDAAALGGRFQMQVILPLAAAALLIGAIAWAARNRRPWGLLAGFALASILGIIAQRHNYPHYYQALLPVIAVGGGWAAVALWPRHRAYTCAAVACLAIWELIPLGFGPLGWSRVSWGPQYAAAVIFAQRIDAMLPPGETFAVWGTQPELYYLTGRRPPTGVYFMEHFTMGPLSGPLTELEVRGLEAHRPALLLVHDRWPKTGPAWGYLAAHYRPTGLGDGGRVTFWLRTP